MQATFVHLEGGKQGHREVFNGSAIKIGRSGSNDLVLPDEALRASSRHAEITINNNQCIIKDLDSRNGTFINGQRVSQLEIKDGDIIELGLGGPKLKFEFQPAPTKEPENYHVSTISYLKKKSSPPAANAANAANVDDKEFGRATVQLIANQAATISSRRWKWMFGSAFVLFLFVTSLLLYQQFRGNPKATTTPIISKNISFAEIATRNERAIVLIYNKYELYDKNGKFIQEQITNGSGFVINPTGEIVTNRHVIEPWEFKASLESMDLPVGTTGKIKQLGIFFANDKLDAEFMCPVQDFRVSKEVDAAILKIDPPKSLKTVEGINSDPKSLHQGDEIVVIGFPLGVEINKLTQDKTAKSSLTRGVISKIPDNLKQIQLDVAAYEGSSGGPIFNSSGQVIGVLTSGPNDTLNFGTPINFVLKLSQRSKS